MTDQALSIFKLLLLGGVYAFFARVLWAVWSEVRPEPQSPRPPTNATAPTATSSERRHATTPEPASSVPQHSVPQQVVVLEPALLAGQPHRLDTALTIGREPANRLVIADDSFVSGHHARIVAASGSVTVADLGSTNGTLVNGQRIDKITTLRVGDRIQIGTVVLEAKQ